MADLMKHHGKYLSRIRKWNGVKQEVVAIIPLRTDKKVEAKARLKIVQKEEKDIKNRVILKHQFNEYFAWLNDKGTSRLIALTLNSAIDKFIEEHSSNVSNESIKRIRISLNRLIDVCKKDTPIAHISNESIIAFKEHYNDIHRPHGINLNLRNIKTFLKWCVEKGYISLMPKIQMVREPKYRPKYITEDRMNRILSLDTISDFYKNAFILYHSTGCRRTEVILGELKGRILVIPATISKSREEREISLDINQVNIVKSIHRKRDKHLAKGSKIVTFKNSFTRAFKIACRDIGLSSEELERINLHCLRHTFAVRQWIISNDIYEVKTLLGHGSVKTTEKYARFNKDRLKQDFPTDWEIRTQIEKLRKNRISIPLISTPIPNKKNLSRRDSDIIADC